jgi:iron(III) transport system permease protein
MTGVGSAAQAERPGPRALSGEPLLLALLLLAGFLLFVLPLWAVLRLALAGPEGGVQAVVGALQSRSVQRALWHSVESSALSALLATVTGAALGLLVGLGDLRGRVALSFVILLPMMIPAHVIAIAWMQTLGPSSALAALLGLPVTPGATHPLYSREGVIALLALQQMPLVFLTFRAGLRALPRDLAEAARVSGAEPWRLVWRIVLPLMRPALVAGFALAFVSALGNFGIPALLGLPGRYVTLPVLMWQRLASSGPSVLTDLAVLAVLIGALAATALPVQMVLQRRLSVALIGAVQAPLRLSLGRARLAVEGVLWLALAGLVLVPLVSLLATALLPTWGVALTWQTATLDAFREVLVRQDVTLRALGNSTLLALLAAAIVAVLALALAPFLRRAGAAGRVARGLALLAELSYALPGLVISVAFIIVFLRPLPLLGVSIYGTTSSSSAPTFRPSWPLR